MLATLAVSNVSHGETIDFRSAALAFLLSGSGVVTYSCVTTKGHPAPAARARGILSIFFFHPKGRRATVATDLIYRIGRAGFHSDFFAISPPASIQAANPPSM